MSNANEPSDPLAVIYHEIVKRKPLLIGDSINDAYTDAEQTVVLLYWLDAVVGVNGFEGYFLSSPSLYVEETSEALLRIGASDCANVFGEAEKVFGLDHRGEKGMDPEDIYESRCRLADALTHDQRERLETIDQAFCDVYDSLHANRRIVKYYNDSIPT